MSRVAVLLSLVLVGALALHLRRGTAPGHRAPAGEEPAWLVDDPDAAYHLRRVQLTLANGGVPRFDRFLNHPEGSPIPWPPVADGVFALAARVALDPAVGDPGLAGYDEDELEELLVELPPLVGVLAVLAVFVAVLVSCGTGSRALWCALLAAAVYAVVPTAVWYGGITRLDHHVWIALLLAVHLAWIGWALDAERTSDAVSGALAAGVTAGIAIASWLAAGVFALVAGGAFALRALGRDATDARVGARAALAYFAAAAGVTLFPASTSAWNAVQPGSLINLTDGVPRALLCAALPFAVLAIARTRLTGKRFARSSAAALAALALVLAVLFLPGFLDGVREGFRWASRENLFMDVVGESRPLDSFERVVEKLGFGALLFPVAWLVLLPSARRSVERAHLLAVSAVLLVMTLGQERFGNAFAVPLALVLAIGAHELAGRVAARRSLPVLAGTVALVLGLYAPSVRAVLAPTEEAYADLADWRREVVRGLRWMRSNTPAPGPWNAPHHPQEWGVLAAWGDGHLIEYHARRPTITTNFGSFVGEENFREGARALLETEPTELARRMRSLGARYLVVKPRQVSDLASTMRIAGEDPADLFARTAGGRKVFGPRATGSALWRLALHAEPIGSRRYPGLELVWASTRLETPQGTRPRAGEPAGPVLSIWRLVEGERTLPERSIVPPD